MRFQKDITLDFVLPVSHWQFAKLLSFTTEIGQKHRVIEYSLKIGRIYSRLRKH